MWNKDRYKQYVLNIYLCVYHAYIGPVILICFSLPASAGSMKLSF
jgi:hypothetical protein